MSNLANIPPRQKRQRFKPNPKRLARLHDEPCIICRLFGEIQMSPTTAHHPICGRYGQKKAPDDMALPVCDGHHQGSLDGSKISVHGDREEFLNLYGPDHKFINTVRESLGEAELEADILGEWF